MRIKRSVSSQKKRRKVLEEAKGYRGNRKARKRDFRRLWITRINAGARLNGLSYNEFMHGLKEANIELNRKMLAEMAVNEPQAFAAIVSRAKEALGAG